MAKILTGKVAAITGGVKGIGLAITDKFLRNNAKVVIMLDIDENQGAHSARKLNDTYGGSRAVFMKCDVTKDLQNVSEDIFEKFGGVDILVNNAGLFNERLVKEVIDVNVTAVINWTKKFNEHMRKDKNGNGGTIINIASVCGFRTLEYAPIYQASKFAVFGFTKSLGHAMNYDKTGVRVVGLCPGFTDTFNQQYLKVWDEDTQGFIKYLEDKMWQSADVVGEAAVEVFEKAPSGTLWVIEGAKPIYKA